MSFQCDTKTNSDEYANTLWPQKVSVSRFCEILFVKMKMSKPSYCRSNDDGTSQINVQTHSNAEKFKIIILSACKTHLLFFFLILCELGPAARNFFPFWWSFTVVLFCFLSVGRWKKNFTRNFDCLRIKLQYFFLLGFGHIDHFSFQKERE